MNMTASPDVLINNSNGNYNNNNSNNNNNNNYNNNFSPTLSNVATSPTDHDTSTLSSGSNKSSTANSKSFQLVNPTISNEWLVFLLHGPPAYYLKSSNPNLYVPAEVFNLFPVNNVEFEDSNVDDNINN